MDMCSYDPFISTVLLLISNSPLFQLLLTLFLFCGITLDNVCFNQRIGAAFFQ